MCYIPSKVGRKVRYESGEVGRENWEVCRESWEVCRESWEVWSENRDVGSERWEMRSKNREVGSERRGISKESPLLFWSQRDTLEKSKPFLPKLHDYPKEKLYLCAWQNTTFPFPVAKRHRYSATSMDYFPMVQHKCSLTYCKIPILHWRASGYRQKAKFRN